MRNLGRILLGVLTAASGLNSQTPAEPPRVFRGAHLVPIVGPEIPNGALVVVNGKITAIGPADQVSVPEGAIVVDVSGRRLLPGFVDTHSHIGEPEGGDRSSPLHPNCRVLDSIDVRDPAIQRAQAGGITTVNIMPGSGHLLSGQTVYVKLREADTLEELLIYLPDGSPAGGIKMANGTNSRGAPPFPGTRAKSAALVRELFVKAQTYQKKLKDTVNEPDKKPERDLSLEALVEVLDGKRVVHHHTHRHDDILTVLRLQKEFGFKVVLHHVSEAWRVAEEIAAAKAPCSVIVVDSPGGKLEAAELAFETCAVLERAGVAVALHTDDPITDSRLFHRSVAMAVRAGFSREGALRALTIEGAKMLELDNRTGSLEVGKDADFVIWSADPLTVDARVLETWVEGRRVFDRANPLDRAFAEGGPGAGSRHAHLDCCFPTDE